MILSTQSSEATPCFKEGQSAIKKNEDEKQKETTTLLKSLVLLISKDYLYPCSQDIVCFVLGRGEGK